MKLALLGSGAVWDCVRRCTSGPVDHQGELLRSHLQDCNVAIANLECAVTTATERWRRTPKASFHRTSASTLEALRAAGVRAVSLANDHVLDFEAEGLNDTLRALDAAGIARAGAGMDLYEAMRPAIFDAAGLRIGLISFTGGEPGGFAWVRRPGVNALDLRGTRPQIDSIETLSISARRAGAELVVVTLHRRVDVPWDDGEEVRNLAHLALKAGVDIVVLFESWGSERGGERMVVLTAGADGCLRTTLGGGTSIVVVEIDRAGVRLLRRFRYGFSMPRRLELRSGITMVGARPSLFCY